MLLRTIAFAFLVLSSGLHPALSAQDISQPTTLAQTDKVGARAFAILFRRENAYLKLAKTAKSPDSPETQLPQVITTLLTLDSAQAASLERFARARESEITPIRSQMVAEISSFYNSFPNGGLSRDIDPSPPVAIRTSRAEIDKVTL